MDERASRIRALRHPGARRAASRPRCSGWSCGRGAARLWGDEIMYADLATRWARGEPATLELLWPPLYPRLLAIAMRVRLGPAGPATGPGRLPLRRGAPLARSRAHADGLAPRGRRDRRAAAARPPGRRVRAVPVARSAAPRPLRGGAVGAREPRDRGRPGSRAPAWLLGVCLLAKSVLGPFLPVLLLPLLRDGVRRGASCASRWSRRRAR